MGLPLGSGIRWRYRILVIRMTLTLTNAFEPAGFQQADAVSVPKLAGAPERRGLGAKERLVEVEPHCVP